MVYIITSSLRDSRMDLDLVFFRISCFVSVGDDEVSHPALFAKSPFKWDW